MALMLTRHGKPIIVAYPEHHQIWIEAANSLPAYEKSKALYDIAELTGRSIGAIREIASQMRTAKIHEDWLRNASAMTASAGPGYKARLGSSELKAPSMARLMGCK